MSMSSPLYPIWHRELGADEVCENYMDAKFGGEEADMAEAQRS